MLKQIKRIVRDQPQHWVGDGFPVRSLFSYAGGNQYDPFLLLDYAGPHEFAPNEAKRGVEEHPHRGFETVTILYEGELEHRDSSGSHGSIGPGDVQWMTAASGIVHEEFHSRIFAQEGGMLEMVQLWVNLPAAAKQTPPKYQDLLASQFPTASLPGNAGIARVIAGELMEAKGPASTFTPINVWDLQLNEGTTTELTIPEGHTSLLIVQKGEIAANGESLKGVELALFEIAGSQIQLDSKTASRILVLTGEPIGEPVVGQGPFVMNTREEIHQAIADYQAGKMGHLPATESST
ncbi:Quercetin 2,3-dioxygenase [Polystyrenella longa]|uniref:Quercetin 2,3-dioxygenase n=1 Tax=Polystyrenella longa TaxID=2528007 RepID=A0A518CM04_9PLAN|nr:pirin family protein [Polystyrenella longa]QDU80258.1 Quercetin 2,3-dioxygenase [Polystyrenella longa]